MYKTKTASVSENKMAFSPEPQASHHHKWIMLSHSLHSHYQTAHTYISLNMWNSNSADSILDLQGPTNMTGTLALNIFPPGRHFKSTFTAVLRNP